MELREIKGFISDGYAIKSAEGIVRFTSDETGESISLQTDDIMIGVPFEKIKKGKVNDNSTYRHSTQSNQVHRI